MRTISTLCVLAAALTAGCAMDRSASAGTDSAHAAPEVPMLVQATCAACHAVAPGTISPTPGAPTFEDIANMPGLTRETLIAFLGDTHNYPDIMDVDLSEQDIEVVADYMLTLRRDDYRRVPS